MKKVQRFIVNLAVGTALIGGGGYAFNLQSTTTAVADPVRLATPAYSPGFADIVEAVSPAVVSVRVKSNIAPVSDRGRRGMPRQFDNLPPDHPFNRFFREFERDREFGQRGERRQRRARPVSQGSGFFISEDGLVVTNNHVIANGTEFEIVMNDGTEYDATLVGTDPRTDLAVLKVDEGSDFTYVEFGDEDSTRVGEWVVAVGNPFGLGGTVTAGIVSARGRDIGAGPYDDFLQIDAAVNRGNSGGPTFNLSGEVVGVNTAIFSPSGGNVGIAFAVPASIANEVVN
ncbi:MAG: trypsin-like peptidase domain-containing protein, partial [Pseudomonadota bacterium]